MVSIRRLRVVLKGTEYLFVVRIDRPAVFPSISRNKGWRSRFVPFERLRNIYKSNEPQIKHVRPKCVQLKMDHHQPDQPIRTCFDMFTLCPF